VVFIVGTGADIAATEGYYAARGKSSLFTESGSKKSTGSYTPSTPAQAATIAKLTGTSSYNFSTNTYTDSSGQHSSMSASNYLKTLSSPKVTPNTNTSSSSSGGSSSNKQSKTSAFVQLISAPAVNPFTGSSSSSNRSSSSSSSNRSSSSNQTSSRTSSNVSSSSSAKTSSTAKSSAPRTAPKNFSSVESFKCCKISTSKNSISS